MLYNYLKIENIFNLYALFSARICSTVPTSMQTEMELPFIRAIFNVDLIY